MSPESIFFMQIMSKPLWAWIIFFTIVITLLVLDLGIFNKTDKEISVKESLRMSVFYITMGLLYGVFVWYQFGSDKGFDFLNGFIVEKSLALDNIFVIAMIFSYFKTPLKYQHRVLFWGILGVILLRGIMIGLGAALVARFNWVLFIFAAFLVYTGIKMILAKEDDKDLSENATLQFLRRHLPVTEQMDGHKFFIRINHKTFVTPLFVALCMVELADVVFAVDSIPAIFTITTDPYVVYTSNIFAILGLRALYFALAAMLNRFYYLKYTLALVLVFIGSKIFVAKWVHLSSLTSLAVTVTLLTSGVVFSLWKTSKKSD